jgi:hypothetical protein
MVAVVATTVAGCKSFANVGDGPPEAVCAGFEDQARPSWCPGGTVQLEVAGAGQPLEFWLLSTSTDGRGEETDLTSHPITDLPAGSYRAFVPWVHCTGTCGGEPIGPFRCEGTVQVPAYRQETVVEVSFNAAQLCTISVRE